MPRSHQEMHGGLSHKGTCMQRDSGDSSSGIVEGSC